MSASTTARYSTRELQAAAAALAAGRFSTRRPQDQTTATTTATDTAHIATTSVLDRVDDRHGQYAASRGHLGSVDWVGAAGAGAGRERRCRGLDRRPGSRRCRRRRRSPDAGA